MNKMRLLTWFGIGVIGFLVVGAVFVPLLSSHTYYDTHLHLKNMPPCRDFWFGSDELGRDIFVRIWWGARISLFVAAAASLLDLCIGVFFGFTAGYFGGKVDASLMRVADILYALPYLIVVILLITLIGSGLFTVILALAATGWINMARIVRAHVLKIKQLDFIKSAQVLGVRRGRLFLRHFFPNMAGPILVAITMTIPSSISAEAFLSFMGLGVQVPCASWGVMAYDGLSALSFYPWRLLFPAAFISVTMIGFHIVGDALCECMDPVTFS